MEIEFTRKEYSYLKGLGFWEIPTENEEYIRTSIRRMIFDEEVQSMKADPCEWFCIESPLE